MHSNVRNRPLDFALVLSCKRAKLFSTIGSTVTPLQITTVGDSDMTVTSTYSMDDVVVTANIGVADGGDLSREMAEAVACGRYMPKKPTKWGFKVIEMQFSVIGWALKSHLRACAQVWALCCSKIGYLWTFEVYQGKRQAAAERDIGASVVERLTRRLPRGTCVTCDRFFTTLKLAKALIDAGKWLIGTVMPGKVDGIPEELNYGKTGSGLKRGTSATRYMTYNGVKIWFTAWMDTKPVYLLHTVFAGDSFSGRAYRWVKKTGSAVFQRICYWCPASFIKYNSLMGGVDTFDHLRAMYTVHLLLKSRWWVYLFFWSIECGIINAYILYCLNPHVQKLTHREFRLELAFDLMARGRPHMLRLSGAHNRATPARHVGRHTPGFIQDIRPDWSRQQHCEVCGYGFVSGWMCDECDLPLCLRPRLERKNSTRNCWALYHDPAVKDYTIYRLSNSKKSGRKRKRAPT